MTDGSCHNPRGFAANATIAVTFAAVDTLMTLSGASWWPAHPGRLAWVLMGVQAAACLTLVVRNRAPITVLAVLGGFSLLLTLLVRPIGVLTPAHPGNVWAPLATVVAAYAPLFHRRNRRASYVALGLLTAVVARVWEPSATVIMIGVLRTGAGPLLALYFDARRRLVCALRERAERAERERHLLAEQARAEERARLAAEMHDVVTHRVSLMVLQAGALRVTAPDERTRQAAEELRTAGCQALEELRDLVGVLHTAPGEDDPAPPGGLAALVEETAAVGGPAELVEEGDPALASPVVARTAYRVVREALTNARKHAPGAPVTVRVEYDQAGVRVTVRNPRSSEPPGVLAATGSGVGIAGLRRRVELVHGTFHAGPASDGGYRVEATLPAYVPTAEPVA